jgi:hypothetical protein
MVDNSTQTNCITEIEKADMSLQGEELFSFLIAEAEAPFAGWDFSYIHGTGRVVDSPLSWSYTSKVLMHLRKSKSLLDMGTGGGLYTTRFKVKALSMFNHIDVSS